MAKTSQQVFEVRPVSLVNKTIVDGQLRSETGTGVFNSFSAWQFSAGRAIGTVLRPSSSVTLCIVAKRCVLEQKLLLTESL